MYAIFQDKIQPTYYFKAITINSRCLFHIQFQAKQTEATYKTKCIQQISCNALHMRIQKQSKKILYFPWRQEMKKNISIQSNKSCINKIKIL